MKMKETRRICIPPSFSRFVAVLCVCIIPPVVVMVQFGKNSTWNGQLVERLSLSLTVVLSSPSQMTDTSLSNAEGTPDYISYSEYGEPRRRIVFLKTHKTGSTTIASIFQRYGYYRNLTFALGIGHVLSFHYKFSCQNVLRFPGMRGRPFDMLSNHARYNRPEMVAVVPSAMFVTILRRPEDQLESAFGYYEMYDVLKLGNEPNSFRTFMEDPMKYYKPHNYKKWQLSRNGMLYDLGFDHKYDQDDTKIAEKITEVDRDFDLVMLSDFFDESLLLLKKLLCCELEDILYISHGIRSASHRFQMDSNLIQKIRAWSRGDFMLYDHFNNTFWKKVADYGPTFQKDLKHFRELNRSVFDDCVNQNTTNKSNSRLEKLTLKNKSERCKSLLRGDVDYTSMIRHSMKMRFG